MASASSGIDYKFTTLLEVLDGGNGAATPNVLETWELYGCYVSSADYGDANYGSNDPMTVALTIVYDNAAQLTKGVGTSSVAKVGRTVAGSVTGVGTATSPQ